MELRPCSYLHNKPDFSFYKKCGISENSKNTGNYIFRNNNWLIIINHRWTDVIFYDNIQATTFINKVLHTCLCMQF